MAAFKKWENRFYQKVFSEDYILLQNPINCSFVICHFIWEYVNSNCNILNIYQLQIGDTDSILDNIWISFSSNSI